MVCQNPYVATVREPYDQYSNAYDNFHYVNVLSPHLTNYSLPAHFIVDQGRVAYPGAREEWGDWCNVSPAGYVLLNDNVTILLCMADTS